LGVDSEKGDKIMTHKDCEICQEQEDTVKGIRLLQRAIETSIYLMVDRSDKAVKEERDARAAFEAFVAEFPHLAPTIKDSPEESQQEEPPEEANQSSALRVGPVLY